MLQLFVSGDALLTQRIGSTSSKQASGPLWFEALVHFDIHIRHQKAKLHEGYVFTIGARLRIAGALMPSLDAENGRKTSAHSSIPSRSLI